MEKVKNIYYTDNPDSEYGSGLYLEMKDGSVYRGQTTDSIIPFERVKELPKTK